MTSLRRPVGEAARALPPHRIRQAVILVGGKGSRLGELTRATPKPLMKISVDRVFLDLLIDNVARQGFDRILLLGGHFGEQIAERYEGRVISGATLGVAVEPEPKGTAGALRWACDKLDPIFLVLNGDTYFDIPYRSLEAMLHDAADALAIMALRDVDDAMRYGSVEMLGDRIVGFQEKVAGGEAGRGRINAGVYLMRREAINSLPEQQLSLETDVFPKLASNGRLFGALHQGYFIDIGLPRTLDQARRDLPSMVRRPALFLDRDGVINIDHGYVHCWDQLDLLPGLAEVIRAFNEAGWFVFVITNQAGVARGYYDESAVDLLHDQIRDWLASRGAHVDQFYYCPLHPQGSIAAYRAESSDRKPGPGMLLRAFAEWPVDIERSFLVGDQETDMAAAAAAGIKGHLFQGGDVAGFFSEQGLWPKHSSEAESLALNEANRERECFG